MKVLLLAGTADARALATLAADMRGVEVIASLSGATRVPADYPCAVRRGGFGGAAGLRTYLQKAGIGALVDATHPFAAMISQSAATVAAALGLPALRLERPPWTPDPRDRWARFADLPAALAALPPDAVALLTTGQSTATLGLPVSPRLILRSIEPPDGPRPDNLEVLLARPPFSLPEERDLMRDLGVTHLVTKNAGGPGRAKLAAAAELGIEVLMVDRPPPSDPTLPLVETPDAALRWLKDVATAPSTGAPRA